MTLSLMNCTDLHRHLDRHRVEYLLEQAVDGAEQALDLFLVDRH